jgi:hypothetical protein
MVFKAERAGEVMEWILFCQRGSCREKDEEHAHRQEEKLSA